METRTRIGEGFTENLSPSISSSSSSSALEKKKQAQSSGRKWSLFSTQTIKNKTLEFINFLREIFLWPFLKVESKAPARIPQIKRNNVGQSATISGMPTRRLSNPPPSSQSNVSALLREQVLVHQDNVTKLREEVAAMKEKIESLEKENLLLRGTQANITEEEKEKLREDAEKLFEGREEKISAKATELAQKQEEFQILQAKLTQDQLAFAQEKDRLESLKQTLEQKEAELKRAEAELESKKENLSRDPLSSAESTSAPDSTGSEIATRGTPPSPPPMPSDTSKPFQPPAGGVSVMPSGLLKAIKDSDGKPNKKVTGNQSAAANGSQTSTDESATNGAPTSDAKQAPQNDHQAALAKAILDNANKRQKQNTSGELPLTPQAKKEKEKLEAIKEKEEEEKSGPPKPNPFKTLPRVNTRSTGDVSRKLFNGTNTMPRNASVPETRAEKEQVGTSGDSDAVALTPEPKQGVGNGAAANGDSTPTKKNKWTRRERKDYRSKNSPSGKNSPRDKGAGQANGANGSKTLPNSSQKEQSIPGRDNPYGTGRPKELQQGLAKVNEEENKVNGK